MSESYEDSGVPNPGSREAVKLGCTCPIMDNGHGYGAEGKKGYFWYDGGCPLHAIENNEVEE